MNENPDLIQKFVINYFLESDGQRINRNITSRLTVPFEFLFLFRIDFEQVDYAHKNVLDLCIELGYSTVFLELISLKSFNEELKDANVIQELKQTNKCFIWIYFTHACG